jgi:hypothetical protein
LFQLCFSHSRGAFISHSAKFLTTTRAPLVAARLLRKTGANPGTADPEIDRFVMAITAAKPWSGIFP